MEAKLSLDSPHNIAADSDKESSGEILKDSVSPAFKGLEQESPQSTLSDIVSTSSSPKAIIQTENGKTRDKSKEEAQAFSADKFLFHSTSQDGKELEFFERGQMGHFPPNKDEAAQGNEEDNSANDENENVDILDLFKQSELLGQGDTREDFINSLSRGNLPEHDNNNMSNKQGYLEYISAENKEGENFSDNKYDSENNNDDYKIYNREKFMTLSDHNSSGIVKDFSMSEKK